ncbi:MAG: hypothetical protein ACOYLG_09975 [Chitinophagaceae bacterium]
MQATFDSPKKWYFAGLLSIILVVAALYIYSDKKDFRPEPQSRQDASGLDYPYARSFVYFYYYTGHFPLSTLRTGAAYNKSSAIEEIEVNGRDLVMESGHWSRLGEHARIWAFMPDAWLRGSPKNPSVKTFNALLFFLGLFSLFHGLFRMGHIRLAFLLPGMVLCLPFFHYEVFSRQNLFALQGSVFMLVMGLILPWCVAKKNKWMIHFLLLLMVGFIIGVVAEMRNENIILLMACCVMILLGHEENIQKRLLYCGLLLLFTVGTRNGIQSYFQKKFDQTKILVAQKKGHVYTGKRIRGHQFWHPVFCGLGDFDRKYGYAWKDQVAYQFAIPILRDRYQISYPYHPDSLHFQAWYDSARIYYIKFDEIEAYEIIMKEKVLHDIQKDPGWYFNILQKRIFRILHDCLPFSNAGFLFFPAIALLYIRKQRQSLALLLASSLPCAVPLLIHSGLGATLNPLYGVVSLAMLIDFLAAYLIQKWQPDKRDMHLK